MADLNTVYHAQMTALNQFRATYGSPMASGNSWDVAMAMLRAAKTVGASQGEALSVLNTIVQQSPDLTYNGEDMSFIQFASAGIF
ncbi:hypothetical protein [Rhodoligotrophos ferricapiens]|uniref:hypothetical protein n=1 Tax=Rhodoligotrophos ferricapiens TaxID=3069264 RepID=UPI00315CAA4D